MLSLDDLLHAVEDAVPPDIGPVWVRVDSSGGAEFSVALRFDVDHLLGWVAPSSCVAVGVVGGGWARLMDSTPSGWVPPYDGVIASAAEHHDWADEDHFWDDEDETGAGAATAFPGPRPAPPLPARVRIGCLMDREGRLASRAQFDDGRCLDTPPGAGRMVDTLRRCMGLPTDAPSCGTVGFLEALWVGEVIGEARRRPSPLAWADAVGLHPAMRVLASVDEGVDLEHFDTVVRVAARAWSWDQIRCRAADGTWLGDLVAPALAAWMDEGMFSRWVVDVIRPAVELLSEAAAWLPPDTLSALYQSIQRGTRSSA